MRALQLALLLSFSMIAVFPCRGQSPLAAIAESHIEANVPDATHFDTFLKRNLETYFCAAINKPVKVAYELLREGPTQTGIAYPKYYAWVKIIVGKKQVTEGAVRLAAIEKKRFEVTDFMNLTEMKSDSEAVFRVFPRAVGERILLRLK